VHLDVADRFGNLFSATPAAAGCRAPRRSRRSAGRSARARRCSGSRRVSVVARAADAAAHDALAGLVVRDGEPWLAYGTPGGDQQEQWALHALVRHVDRGPDLQEAIDAPEWHTDHLIASFYPAASSLVR
jgi:gamma-glutamyltranspeptidase/glutathione hydrolase